MQQNDKIFVTQPSLSPLNNYTSLLNEVWDSGILTHNGPKVRELEKKLSEILGLKGIVAVTNGTIALQLSIRALNLEGEIITTPFTWIATVSAIRWEGCKPVFVDINPDTFNIDADKIEDAITEDTVAIMPVHVFSNPCEIEKINKIAKKYGLKVIYDAAHALFVNYKEKSILSYGNISATSFHATKVFNTGEGGACTTNDLKIQRKLKALRFFGYDEDKDIIYDGINGKMTEIHASLGLANLRYVDQVLNKRKDIYQLYYENLKDYVTFQYFNRKSYNYSYVPVLFKDEGELKKVEHALNENNIFPRRYFYPSLNKLGLFKGEMMPVSENISSRILCLPSYTNLDYEDQFKISSIIKHNITK